ncbi:Sodium-coupled monocarboxylate transporter 1 [Orchesella cincta]|uniref:Sodium-coupled monocarboxylate transporter 1 n=1 Tax=Orchesella cincta TaxID=48709 RepID=A0A1D2MV68_ORCCI|nr:Sodium-coupled monocarboxylate transporter 1 [Orchesella cincta]
MDAPEGTRFVVENFHEFFQWPEYFVFCLVLGLSLGIGIFFGCFGTKTKSNEEFLMAGRSMSILPVTFSLICSFVSAVTLLGHPVEIYYYGQQHTVMALAFIPMTFTLMYWFVPVFFELKLTSAYEYFEWRYSRKVRVMCSIFAIIHLICYLPICVLGPSLAMDQVAGFRYEISSAAMFIVCICYSSLGGLKAVLWTDVLQAVVMMITLGSLAVCGLIEVGGISTVWERSKLTGRTDVFSFDPDPRTRYTVWTSLIGGYFLEMTLFGATQSQIQRYNSVPTLRQSKQCLMFNMVGMMFVNVICSFLGMILFAKYWLCDPLTSTAVSSSDQTLPLFVMDALRDYPLIPGILIAGITCGSLSTMSSALNSLTAVITEDFVKHYKPHLSDEKLGFVSKLISITVGMIAFGLVFVIKIVNKTVNLSPLSTLFVGSLLGPILGAFTLGLLVPWSNNVGTCLGLITSILFSGTVGLGNIIAAKDGKLPNMKFPLSTAQCLLQNTTSGEVFQPVISNVSIEDLFQLDSMHVWKERDDSFAVQVWSTSFMWQPGIGCVSMLILGSLFSFIVILFDRQSIPKVHKNLISPPWLRFWERCCGREVMSNWVDYDKCETFRKKVSVGNGVHKMDGAQEMDKIMSNDRACSQSPDSSKSLKT